MNLNTPICMQLYNKILHYSTMEYDNDENTWRRSQTPKPEPSCHQQIPKRSTSLAVVLFRHGARTPVVSYNSDPYKNYQWPDGLGGLTNA
ncbi:Lysosomal acid phosphatase [Operophtera brumata]|uniref:Lysosomal acid phosphatase n=1 Tax=Operophtera brumata TaxID=104452 RepID=A0A0L7LGR3_OPEBR|nr:Lysosomal acid phosphatase [Operophtera brumata]